jgi:hypothetical protein
LTLPLAQGVLEMSKPTIEQKWRQQIEKVKAEAAKLPPSNQRDALFQKARQLETASHLAEWMSSPGCSRRNEFWSPPNKTPGPCLAHMGKFFLAVVTVGLAILLAVLVFAVFSL